MNLYIIIYIYIYIQINRPITHVKLLYKENVHNDSIIDGETGYP